jgi:hypothetical protein
MHHFRRSLQPVIVSALLLTVGTFVDGLRAEEDYRIIDDVFLTNVRVSPMKSDDQARITFVLGNRSAERILFGGIAITDARCSEMVASLGNGATTTLHSIPVAPGEVLSVDGEALWIEIDGLPVSPSGMIKATVRFGTAVIPISLSASRERKPSSSKARRHSTLAPLHPSARYCRPAPHSEVHHTMEFLS